MAKRRKAVVKRKAAKAGKDYFEEDVHNNMLWPLVKLSLCSSCPAQRLVYPVTEICACNQILHNFTFIVVFFARFFKPFYLYS